MSNNGWFGESSQLLYALETFGADKDENGCFVVFDAPVTAGFDGGVCVPENAKCLINGKPSSIADLMRQTSYGISATII